MSGPRTMRVLMLIVTLLVAVPAVWYIRDIRPGWHTATAVRWAITALVLIVLIVVKRRGRWGTPPS